MPNLVPEFRQGEIMFIDSTPICLCTKSRIAVTTKTRFLGKQIMRPDQARTPARRFYFALSSAYTGVKANGKLDC